MIEKLRLGDIKEAARVYNKGLRMETPKGERRRLEETIKHLKEVRVFVYKENQKIKGLLSFKIQKNRIRIDLFVH